MKEPSRLALRAILVVVCVVTLLECSALVTTGFQLMSRPESYETAVAGLVLGVSGSLLGAGALYGVGRAWGALNEEP